MYKQSLPREVWVLVSASFVIALGYGIVAPVLPLYALEFDVGLTEVSAIISVFAATRLLFAPAAGYLVQKFGEKSIYISGLLIVAVSTGACAFAVSYWQLLSLRAVAGIGSTMFTVSAMGLLIRISPPTMRARISSLYSGSFLVGGVAGPILGAAVAGFGLRAPFIIYAAALTIACVVVAVSLSKAHLGEKGSDARPTVSPSYAWRQPAYRAAVMANFSNGWVSFGVRVSLVPAFMWLVFPGSPQAAALAITMYALGNAIIILPAGRWSDRHGRRPFIITGLLLAGVSTLFLGFVDNLILALLLSAFAGVGSGFTAPSQQAVVADIIGQKARGGQVLATFQMAADLGAVIGPIAIGSLADNQGFGVAFLVTGMLLVLAAAVWMFTKDPRERTETQEMPVVPQQPSSQ
ncbi:MFS transporter [Lysinibacter sp. HNR]|uniref:MFS transporter n=1 Tax=Lysinibacter sp. HNR TaxID=3031408 RepID=UPI0024352DE2|nr:MFS transporter [Lysinibacter sp. HNR]WGD36243.1 MFS transporter [Lysinibacter sp. HNR]